MRHAGSGSADRRASSRPGWRRWSRCSCWPRSPPSPRGAKSTPAATLAGAIGRRIACAPRLPDACRHHPLVPAYGWPLARLARALAPAPAAAAGPLRPAARPGRLPPLPPGELRRRRRPPPDRLGPAHHRLHPARATAATRSAGSSSTTGSTAPASAGNGSSAAPTRRQVDAASRRPVLLKDDPALVPLETLPGRDHYDFPAGERPPWQWQVEAATPAGRADLRGSASPGS